MEDALRIAKPFAPRYAGIDIERLSADVSAWLRSGSYNPPFPAISHAPSDPPTTSNKEKAPPFPGKAEL